MRVARAYRYHVEHGYIPWKNRAGLAGLFTAALEASGIAKLVEALEKIHDDCDLGADGPTDTEIMHIAHSALAHARGDQ